MIFALITQTQLVHVADLFRMCPAIELNAQDCARIWDKQAPAIVVGDDLKRLPMGCLPLVCVADDTDQGALAAHFPGGFCRVHVDRTSGFERGDESVCNGACHEVLEAMIDLPCDFWKPSNRDGIEVALEVCDPLQTSYERELGGTTWSLANFVRPEWFMAGAIGALDFVGELGAPFQVGPNGYAIFRRQNADGSYTEWLENASGAFPRLTAAQLQKLIHPMGRTNKRLHGVFQGRPELAA